MSVSHIADRVDLNRRFIYKWAKRFLHERVAGLADRAGRGTGRHTARAKGTAALLHHR
jgi:transposase